MRSPFANLSIGDILITAGTWDPATEYAALAAYHKAAERPAEIEVVVDVHTRTALAFKREVEAGRALYESIGWPECDG